MSQKEKKKEKKADRLRVHTLARAHIVPPAPSCENWTRMSKRMTEGSMQDYQIGRHRKSLNPQVPAATNIHHVHLHHSPLVSSQHWPMSSYSRPKKCLPKTMPDRSDNAEIEGVACNVAWQNARSAGTTLTRRTPCQSPPAPAPLQNAHGRSSRGPELMHSCCAARLSGTTPAAKHLFARRKAVQPPQLPIAVERQ
jgi:hypothetical protein